VSPDAVILSPHFDDAVLSCWHVLTGAGDVLVVNVFAGEPPAGTLGWWDELAGASDSATAVRTRIDEDRRALALAGRSAVNLPFLDGQYRECDQAQEKIVRALRDVIATGPQTQIYAPAGLGDHHRDHIAVRGAALALRAEGAHVALYADLPHATVLGLPRWVTDGGSPNGADRADAQWASQLEATNVPVERMTAAAHRLSSEDHANKLQAVLTYASQIAPLQRVFGRAPEDPLLLGFEVDWRLPLVDGRQPLTGQL
jgi:GlcNAc-PI de-N-acetylase